MFLLLNILSDIGFLFINGINSLLTPPLKQAIRLKLLIIQTWIEMEQPAPMLALPKVRHQIVCHSVCHKISDMAEEIICQSILHPSSQAPGIMEAILVKFTSLWLLHVTKDHYLSFRVLLLIEESRQHVNGAATCEEENINVFGMYQDFLQEHLPHIFVLRPLNSYPPRCNFGISVLPKFWVYKYLHSPPSSLLI